MKKLKMILTLTSMFLSVLIHSADLNLVTLLKETALKKGIDAAIAQHKDLIKKHKDQYTFNEKLLNSVAQALIKAGKPERAVTLLKYNASQYPDSALTFYKLAEACERAGHMKDALNYYRIALQKTKAVSRKTSHAFKRVI